MDRQTRWMDKWREGGWTRSCQETKMVIEGVAIAFDSVTAAEASREFLKLLEVI